jgi:hypothetical protein
MITFASGAVRSFGFAKARALTTYTFPAGTSTWTAPAGVTNIVSGVGKGSDGTSDTWGDIPSGANYLGYTIAGYPYDPGYPTTTKTAGDAYTAINTNGNNILSVVTATSPPGNYLSNWPFYEWFPGWPTSWTCEENISTFGGGYYYRNTTPSIVNPFTPGSTNPLAYEPSRDAHLTGLYRNTPGMAGMLTIGFGKTWAGGDYTGGVGYPAPTTTVSNIAVSPGTTYTIYNRGSLTISY